MAEQPRILTIDSAHGSACWRNLLIVTWWGEADQSRHERLFEAGDELLREMPTIGLLAIIEAGATPPDRSVLKTSNAKLTALGADGKLLAVASVLEGEGVMRAVNRTFLSLMVTATSRDIPSKVEASMESAIEWLAPILGWPDPHEAQSALRGLRSTFREHPARVSAAPV